MAQGGSTGDNRRRDRDDRNRERHLQALRELADLLRTAVEPGFFGEIRIEIPVQNGELGHVRSTKIRTLP